MLIFAISFVSSAIWVSDPLSCPSEFQSQNAQPGEALCGYNLGTAYWYNMNLLNAPSSTNTFTALQAGLSGFVLDCEAYDGSVPHCDSSIRCVRDSSCYSVNRLTECTDFGTFNCGSCGPGYQACDGSFTDANGCEVQTGVTSRGTNVVYGASCSYQCSSGYLDCNGDGTGSDGACEIRVGVTPFTTPNTVYQTCTTGVCSSGWMACEGDTATSDGCNTQIGSQCTTIDGKPGSWQSGCACTELEQEHFITNTEAKGWGDFLLFGRQYNPLGWLMNLTSASGNSIGIDNESCIVFSDGSVQCSAGEGVNFSDVEFNDSVINVIEYHNGSIVYVDENFMRRDGDNATGRYNFNGGWDVGGITFDLGDIFAQRLFVFNITSLSITNLNVNGSLIPFFDDFFDLGSSVFRWRNGYFSNDVFIGNKSVIDLIEGVSNSSNNYTYSQIQILNNSLIDYVDNSSSGGVGKVVGITTTMTNGNIVSGAFIGYAAGNDICNSEFLGSHFCSTGEVIATIADGNYSFVGYPWFSNGPPGYTSNSNDCNGWTDGSSNYLGPFWNWELNAQAGAAFLTPCSQVKNLLCCI